MTWLLVQNGYDATDATEAAHLVRDAILKYAKDYMKIEPQQLKPNALARIQV